MQKIEMLVPVGAMQDHGPVSIGDAIDVPDNVARDYVARLMAVLVEVEAEVRTAEVEPPRNAAERIGKLKPRK